MAGIFRMMSVLLFRVEILFVTTEFRVIVQIRLLVVPSGATISALFSRSPVLLTVEMAMLTRSLV